MLGRTNRFLKAASSQRRNLVFTAHTENIHVWVPDGPLQLLGSQAAMVIKPVMKSPHSLGYINPAAPHTINNIIVEELGRDEVLVLATDSGNVCAYHVEAIYSAVNRHAKSGGTRPFHGTEADPVSPFLVENVEESAWGLAVHKFARMIAVSANTSQITVFAFALVDPASRDDNNSLDTPDTLNLDHSDQTWISIENNDQLQRLQGSMPHNHRSQNLRLTYRGHFNNIPSVSFANFDLDASGQWLVSTDITNKVIIWRIWEYLWPWETYFPGPSALDARERGWTVIPLDPRTFRDQHSVEDACGCNPKAMLDLKRVILDVSKTIEEVPDASQSFVASEQKVSHQKFLPDDLASHDCCIDLSPSSDNSAEVPDVHVVDQADEDDEANSSDDSNASSDGSDTLSEREHHSIRLKRFPFTLFEEDNAHHRMPPRLYPLWEEPFDEIPPPGLQDMDIHREDPSEPTCPKRSLETDQDLLSQFDFAAYSPTFFPVLHFSEHHITLSPYPMNSEFDVLCRNPLIQEYSFGNEMSAACDRFNLVKYVPELGIVVAASQKGRVAIVSLTRHQEIGYAFRVDWILPFCTQEQNRDRPRTPLLGLAVSPMPGFEIPPDIPSIPRGVDPLDWVEFNYRILNSEDEDAPVSPSSSTVPSSRSGQSASHPAESDSPDSNQSSHKSGKDREPTNDGDESNANNSKRSQTLPEIHAQASRAYRPQERWHGWHPSRHYRLLLFYCDHTVMSYEFWHDWKN